MIDFHSHILPGIDDGSRSIEETVSLLHLSCEQGVRQIVATPHYYASEESPESFIKRRNSAYESIQPVLDASMPEIFLGAEVYYYTGITRSEDLHSLCIQNSKVLLLEMPFKKWSDGMVKDILELVHRRSFTVVLAHIDRYLPMQDKGIWKMLKEQGVLFQLNASTLSEGFLKSRQTLGLIKRNQIDVIGSDCHNMRNRKPNLDTARQIIERRAGKDCWIHLQSKAAELLT